MHAIRVHTPGGPEVLKYERVEKPIPKAGEVVVKNAAAGVNYIDIYHRTGLYKLPVPFTLGREGAGVVEQLGEGVTDFQVGDRVAYVMAPAYADYAVVPTAKACKIPDGVATTDAAAIMLQGLTAHYLVRTTFPLNNTHTALIHAGAGGLGQILIQAAKHIGATVITTVSSKEKAELVKSLGADHVILYTSEDVKTEVRRLTNGKGVQVVYDSVGASTFQGSLDSLAPLGYLVLIGNASGPVPPIDPLVLSDKGSLFVTRPTLLHHIATPEAFHARTKELFGWLQSGAIKLSPPTTFPLADAADAHEFITSRQSTGKILLIPGHL